MLRILFILKTYLLPKKLTRKLFEKYFKYFSNKITNKSIVLNFASADLKYREYFKGCDYTAGDICFNFKEKRIDSRTIAVFAGFNENPFTPNSFDVVISTNSIVRSSFNDEIIIKNFTRLIDCIKKGGG